MRKIITEFQSEAAIREYVLASELAFEQRLSLAVEEIVQAPRLKILTLSGPSCSGKTTASNKIEQALRAAGRTVHTISIDDFFLDRSILLERAERAGENPDFDSPSSINHRALADTVNSIFLGKEFDVPRFDFCKGSCIGYRRIVPQSSDDVFFFEGIQAVYPSVTALFRGHPFLSVYISVCESAGYGDVLFSPNEIRFLRRLVRDNLFRGASPEFTFRLWENVRRNEDVNIFPYADAAGIRINSYLPYEVNMGKPFTLRLLGEIPRESKYFSAAEALIKKLEPIPEIPSIWLPRESLFREFLG
jgi:uridine kinase